MTQTRQQARASTDDSAVADLAPIDLDASAARLTSLPQFFNALAHVEKEQRAQLAGQLIDVLVAMREPGHEAEEAELILAALESEVLNGVIDERGRSARKEAVETLLACGYPHAMMLAPDDVRHARTYRAPRPRTHLPVLEQDDDVLAPWEVTAVAARRLGASAMVAGQVIGGGVVAFANQPSAIKVISAVPALFALFGAAWLARGRPRDTNIGSVGAGLTVLMLMQFFIASMTGGWALLAPASIGLGVYISVMGLGSSERADRKKPTDWDYTTRRWR